MTKKPAAKSEAKETVEKPKVFKEQFEDEEVLLVFKKHPITMRKGLILASLGFYIMTDRRFIQQTRSLLQINVVDISLEQIQMINYQIVGLEQTLLHYGTIIVQTYVGDLVIHEVHHPEKVQKEMVHILRDLGIHASVRPGTEDQQRIIES